MDGNKVNVFSSEGIPDVIADQDAIFYFMVRD
jgi:hypothetical protein